MHLLRLKIGRSAHGLVLGFVLCAQSLGAFAEASKFTAQSVEVVASGTAFGPIKAALPMGTPLVLPVGPSPRARELFDKGFQVRIFRVAAAGEMPRHLDFFDPCYIYLSTVVHFDGSKAVEATVSYLNHIGWLDVSDGGAKPGRFLLVVEAKGGGGSIFRLNGRNKERERYFHSGLYFEVHAGRQVTPAEIALELADMRRFMQKAMDQAKVNSQDLKCYRLQARYARDEDELLAYAQPPCDDPVEFAADQ